MNSENSRYWAWEFLRRNHTYRMAFEVVSGFSPKQRRELQATAHRMLAIDEIEPSLPFAAFVDRFDPLNDWKLDWLDPERMTELQLSGSIGDVREALVPGAVKRRALSLDERYSLESYGLAAWISPHIDANQLDERSGTANLNR